MKKLVVIVLIAIFFFLWIDSGNEIELVCYEDECFSVEIADSVVERSEGLMNR